MKKMFVLIFMFVLGLININAYDFEETFYYDIQIKNMYISRVKGDTIVNSAPFLIHKSNGELVYCIEPLPLLYEGVYEGYYGYIDKINLSQEIINKMNIIAYYGYGYEGHTDLKWYGLTQYLMWEQLSLDDLYFTDKFKGEKIIAYTDELNELRNLVNDYYKVPSFDDVINIEAGTNLTLIDENNVLNNYDIVTDLNVSKNNNILQINDLKEGSYKIEFVKKHNSHNYSLFYSSNGQNLLFPGKINDIKKEITINVKKGQLSIQKHDKVTDVARSNLTFEGAIYGVYDLDGNLVTTVTLDNLGKSFVNLKFGSYYLQELTAPVGYLKDDTKHYFTIDFDNNIINLDVYDEVISKNVRIYKLYGNRKDAIYAYEEGAAFEVYDANNNLIGTYITDSRGIIDLNLPYGKYRIHQISSKEGYDVVEDYIIDVTDTNAEEIKLYDYEKIVDVPDTYKDEIDYKGSILILMLLLIFNTGIYAYRKNIISN